MSSPIKDRPLARLKFLRKRLRKTQSEMAGLLHISLKGYQRYERGEREIPAATIDRAREHLGVNPRWLLDGIGEMFIADAPAPEAKRIRRTLGLGMSPGLSSVSETRDNARAHDVLPERETLAEVIRALEATERYQALDSGEKARAIVALYEVVILTGTPPAQALRGHAA